MIQHYFKIKKGEKLIGIKFQHIFQKNPENNFSKTLYFNDGEKHEDNIFIQIDLDEFLDLGNHYKVLEKSENTLLIE